MSFRWNRGRKIGSLAAALALVAGACTTDQFVDQLGIPGPYTDSKIEVLGVRDVYTDAVVETAGKRYRFFFPPTDECHAVLNSGTQVGYGQFALLGRLKAGEYTCDPVGLLSLKEWRDRRPRRRRSEPLPRAQATWVETYRDKDLIILKGRFPLAVQIGWAGGVDSLAVLPNQPVCDALVDAGVASMEYRDSGSNVFSLLGKDALCPMLGFVREWGDQSEG